MLKNLSDNLNMLMSKHRVNSNELARQINIPATTIKRIRNNEQANPTLLTILPIANYFAVKIDELLGSNFFDEYKSISNLRKLPLLTWSQYIDNTDLNVKCDTYTLTEKNPSDKAFALMIESNEFEVFPRNSILIVDPEKKPESNNYVIVARSGSKGAAIRKYIVEIDQIYLKPLVNGLHISLLTPEYQILGVIVQYKVDLTPEK